MRFRPLLVLGLLGSGLVTGIAPQQDAVTMRDNRLPVKRLEERGFGDFIQGLAKPFGVIWDEVKDKTSCAGCHAVIALLKGLAMLGENVFIKVLQGVCKLTGKAPDDVCRGAIAHEGPLIRQNIDDMDLGSDTADQFCITMIGLCSYPDVSEWSVPFMSEKPAKKRPVSKGKKTIKVVHYSDIHIDPLYTVGANTDCGRRICCRSYEENDEPGKTKKPAGPNGDHNCDVPVSLEKSLYKAIGDIVPDAAFTLFTGDMVDHAMWNTTQDYNEHLIQDAYHLMGGVAGHIYSTAGNHESHPTNAYQPPDLGNSSQWLFELLSDQWSTWIGPTAADNVDKMGAYSTKYPKGNLRIISLNTNYYYRHNFYMYREEMLRDPSNQIAWLVGELHAAEKAGENVYIIGHMPLGDKDSFYDQSNYLDQVVNRFEATIAGMFFGHTHRDEIQLSYSDNRHKNNAIVTSWIGPSLTPTAGQPSFKVYEVDAETFAVLDATTYIADMTNKAFQTTGPVWTKYYSAKETYGKLLDPPVTDPKAELSPAFWHSVSEVFENDKRAFDDFRLRKTRGWKSEKWEACDDDCRETEICQMRAARSQDNCYEPEFGFHFGKRDDKPRRASDGGDECGNTVSRDTLASLQSNDKAMEYLRKEYKKEKRAAERRMQAHQL